MNSSDAAWLVRRAKTVLVFALTCWFCHHIGKSDFGWAAFVALLASVTCLRDWEAESA